MDPFALVLVVGLLLLVLAVVAVGRFYPGSGLEQLGLREARQIIETREALEAEDLEQMVAARNARRRARGQAEVSTDDVEREVMREVADRQRRRERDLAHDERRRERDLAARDLEGLLEVSNARRRARGLPERTPGQAREEFGAGQDRRARPQPAPRPDAPPQDAPPPDAPPQAAPPPEP